MANPWSQQQDTLDSILSFGDSRGLARSFAAAPPVVEDGFVRSMTALSSANKEYHEVRRVCVLCVVLPCSLHTRLSV